ncbi:MAG: M3 family metallopeptidase [Chryseobacterium sp.]|nr:M3 family metallopeptidase [Chryseobacterium sp.]
MPNILTQRFSTPYNSVPFPQIREEHYLPAFEELIAQAEQEINEITENPESPTFENTIEALAYSGEKLEVVSSTFFNINSAETNDEIQNIAQKVSPMLTEFSSKISQNEALFERIKTVFDQKNQYALNPEQQMLLNETYKGFVRSGALLNDTDKKKLEKLNMELAVKSLQFGQNVLAATNDYFLHITDKQKLKGIPDAVLEQYAQEATERNLDGYVITLQYPSYLPAVTYAENRELRKELTIANGKKSFDGKSWDNQELIKEIVSLRQEKSQLLGYENYAAFVLEERMAKSPLAVQKFLNELLEKATPFAQREIEELKTLAKEDHIEEMQIWDHAYYAEKLRKQKFDLNDEELKPYFRLDKVEEAVFGLAEKLFGLTFLERNDIPKYHPEVKTYEVLENGRHKALLYTDYHPRKGKRAGAWMTSYTQQYKKNNEDHRPHISIVCNFTPATKETPSLLTFQEVTTLFHEFGHALHGILANTQYPTLSGTSVKWDFVELPSQFLENYCYEPEFLKTFAKHYETGEVLPDEKIRKLAESKNFMEGYQTLRQIGFGLLDMAYHTNPSNMSNIKEFETEKTKATNLYPIHPETAASTSFSHIFQGGYSAGYYSYKWAEVLDADAFQYFKENGIFNENLAAKFKNLLSSGGTQDPMELYKNFRGSEPKTENLLKRAFG